MHQSDDNAVSVHLVPKIQRFNGVRLVSEFRHTGLNIVHHSSVTTLPPSSAFIATNNDFADRTMIDSGNNTTAITTTNEQDQEQPQQQQQQSNDAPISNIPSPDDKVKIHFVAVGSAPILKRTKFQISADQRFAAVHVFLRKLLKLPSIDSHSSGSGSSNTSSRNNLFLYCCSAFVPSPDHLVGELRDSFANVHTNELVIHYSIQEAWG